MMLRACRAEGIGNYQHYAPWAFASQRNAQGALCEMLDFPGSQGHPVVRAVAMLTPAPMEIPRALASPSSIPHPLATDSTMSLVIEYTGRPPDRTSPASHIEIGRAS